METQSTEVAEGLPVTDVTGDRLVDLVETQDESFGVFAGTPMPLALVMAWVQERCLLVLDRWKGSLELPGGTNTDGESLQLTADREFTEEAGIVAPGLDLVGVATFELGDLKRREHAALYETHLELTPEQADQVVVDFSANAEIDAVALWDPRSPWPSSGGQLDAAIVRWRQGVTLRDG